jgi:peptide-methionine (S)-S-oxide reductase
LQEAAFGARILKHLPGVLDTPGRANGCTKPLKQTMMVMSVKTTFDSKVVSIEDLIHRFNEIIDPIASTNKETI